MRTAIPHQILVNTTEGPLLMSIVEKDERRFWRKVQTPNRDGCMLWTGSVSRRYGYFSLGNKQVRAHRFSYALLVGPIPEGLVVDHVRRAGCRSTLCVNPLHLEPVTQLENSRRGVCGDVNRARQLAKTHCPAGHSYDSENTYITPNGRRQCRLCKRETNGRYKARRKAAKAGDDR